MTAQAERRPLLTPPEVAKFLSVPVATLMDWRYRETGPPYIKIRGRVRYDPADLDAWLRRSRVAH